MAVEGVSITEGSGKNVAVDTIDSKEFQLFKLALGADGVFDNMVDAGQQAMAASLPVVLASDQTAVPAPADPFGANADAAVAAGAAGSIQAKLRRLTTDLGTLIGKVAGAAFGTAGTPSADVVSVQGVGGGTAVPVSVATVPSHAVTNAGTFAVQTTTLPTQAYGSPITVTRPANVTQYTAGDCLGAAAAAVTFTAGAGAGEYLITSAALEVDVAAVPAGMGNFKLHLYSVTPPSALADNAPFDLPAGDRASYLGYIDLGTPVDLGSTLYVEQNGINKQITLASASLFGYLVTDGAFTPAGNSEVYVVTLHTLRV